MASGERPMTKEDLILEVAKRGDLAHAKARAVVNLCFRSIVQALYNDEKVEIRMFGSFANRNYKAYKGRNPKSGTIIEVGPKKAPFFKAGKELKESVNRSAKGHTKKKT